jgi:N-formylglutamate deformylase
MLCERIGNMSPRCPLLLTIPHSGEVIPPEAPWLEQLPRAVFLRDIDRFVDELYRPAIQELNLATVLTRVHRYAADLNRYPTDVDADSVQGSNNQSGGFSHGFHWVKSTQGELVLNAPMTEEVHALIVERHHDGFHRLISETLRELHTAHSKNVKNVYHLDLHSMPSKGTGSHADQGRTRAEIVLSDFDGKSCSPAFLQWALAAFKKEGFEVAVNWPYKGGRITQRYGKPASGHHTLQIELNRALYMDEVTREKLIGAFENVQLRLGRVLARIAHEVETATRT